MNARSILIGFVLACLSATAAHYPALRFSPASGEILDLDTPTGQGPFFTVVAVHGGGWTGGNRQGAEPFCRTIIELGFACVSVDYRLAPASEFPVQAEDIVTAVKFLLARSQRYRLNPRGVFLAGESAGAHIVSYIGARHDSGIPILGLISFSAPTDLAKLAEPGRVLSAMPPGIRDLLGIRGWTAAESEKMRRASPLFSIQPEAPPFLLIHGVADAIVPFAQSTAFCEALRAARTPCELIPVAKARHGLWSEEQFADWQPSWRPPLERWLQIHKP